MLRTGIGVRRVPNTDRTGFSGMRAAVAVAPVFVSTASRMVWMSSLDAAVRLFRTGVDMRTEARSPTGVTEATLRKPVLVTPVIGGSPGPGGGMMVGWPGLAAPPIAVRDLFVTRPLASRKLDATPSGP